MTFAFFCEIDFENLATVRFYLLTFIHTPFRCDSKESLLSTVIPSIFTLFSLLNRLPLTLICKLSSVVNIIWDLPLFTLKGILPYL